MWRGDAFGLRTRANLILKTRILQPEDAIHGSCTSDAEKLEKLPVPPIFRTFNSEWLLPESGRKACVSLRRMVADECDAVLYAHSHVSPMLRWPSQALNTFCFAW